ncbi:MAG: RNA-binding transcriptional accessory protein [Ruminococcaceae bacterium]|nr:RNA-binding transcriptional accessory protein [Oscillospiraceae bacterium]
MDIIKTLASELELKEKQVADTVALIDDGNTIPFIARYRKEVTGSLDDEILRRLFDRLNYLRSLDERREEILRLIDEQGNLTDELREKIEAATVLQELEDIYRPFRPKRRTRATIAKEKGLEPLANLIYLQAEKSGNPYDFAAEYINEEKEVLTAEDAVAGAMDIIAESISDDADYRKEIRAITFGHGIMVTKAATEEDSVYSMYYEFSEPVKKIAGHRVLAINRGEAEKMISADIDIDEELILKYLYAQTVKESIFEEIMKEAVADSYKRLIKPSIEREIRNAITEDAEEQAIKLFSKNLHQLLMQPPMKGKTVLGLDPGYRTGCKLAVVDETGKVCDTGVVFCTLEHHDKQKSNAYVKSLIAKHGVELIAIGNGTASKESEIFIASLLKELDTKVYYMMVSEAGASVYSASKLAAEEFPDFTVEQRSAASIARRIQDPLAELVKIDPKSIGVGQYQHDMNQKRLSEALGGVVENCVNSVGVDLNTASAPLLSYVAGVSMPIAKNIVKYREDNGKFTSRKQLLKVAKLGPKAFTQCAGFLRIPGAEEFLDTTSVHPESYDAALALITELGYSGDDVRDGNISDIKLRMKNMNLDEFCCTHGVGRPTVTDIVDSLLKPGRDPRDEMPKPVLMEDVMSIEDLKPGMVMTGTVRNVIDFGAFVDIGVHQDGLVHISQISNKFIKHPTDVLSVGDIVKVKIIDIDLKKNRISLSMKEV